MAGIKGVKSGNMEKLRNLTEKDLWTMSRKEMEELLYSTSKNITASVRKLLRSEDYGQISMFLKKREKNKYPMPREIKLKTARRMDIEQLKQELRDLSYTANLKTYNISGTKKMLSDFNKKTGKDFKELIKNLTEDDWEKINDRIEETGKDGSASVIKAFDMVSREIDDIKLNKLEDARLKAEQNASADVEKTDPYNLVKQLGW